MEPSPSGLPEPKTITPFVLPTLAIVAVLIFFGSIIFKNESAIPNAGDLTLAEARRQVVNCRETGEAGQYDSCTVEIFEDSDQWYVRATYHGVADEAVASSRATVKATWTGQEWLLSDEVLEVACRPGHGHSDFSVEPCV